MNTIKPTDTISYHSIAIDNLLKRLGDLEYEFTMMQSSKLDELVETEDENVYMFKDWELGVIKKCLEYARHKLSEHHNSGLHKARVKIKDIERILEKIK